MERRVADEKGRVNPTAWPYFTRFWPLWVVVGLLCLTCLTSCQQSAVGVSREGVVYPLGDFTLTERSGREVHASDLAGKVWIASFIFTRCTGPCPRVTAAMRQLQDEFAADSDVRLVTFTVDPEYDTADILKHYADKNEADPQRWLFLTGDKEAVYGLLRDRFHVGAEKDPTAPVGQSVNHDTHLAVVDQRGRVRGYFPGAAAPNDADSETELRDGLRSLREEVNVLRAEALYPPLNAALNAGAGVLLLAGFFAIRRRWVRLHVGCMASALVVSAAFLASYLYYHLAVRHGAPTTFQGQWPNAPAWTATLYYIVLGSHTILAAVTAPLALYTAYLGVRRRWPRHVRIARWTLPIWLYVSATGVVVYWMLYRLY
jgi:cytochrome oxidase Cu insertion factor (SCO1/SenC/PrrC family)/uncharacterized membrane protein YozB (DUF420 family)